MANGLGHALADLLMAAKYRISGASITGAPAAPYYGMLHNGDPGPNGTANTINGGRRVQISNASSGQMVSSGAGSGQVESTADTPWLAASDKKTVTNMTVWAGSGAAGPSTGGVLVHSGPCVGSYDIGDNPTIFAGDFTDAAVIT